MHSWRGQGKLYLYTFFIQLDFWILFYASLFWVILGFRRGVDEICTILGYYAAWAFKMGPVACAETSV